MGHDVYPTELGELLQGNEDSKRISIPLDDRHVLIFNPGSEAESQQRLGVSIRATKQIMIR